MTHSEKRAGMRNGIMRAAVLIAIAAMLVLPGTGRADDVKPEVKISGLMFGQAVFFMGNSKTDTGGNISSFSSFDIPRVYLNTEVKLDDKITAFVQLEANKISIDQWSSAAVDKTPYIKQANIKYKDIFKDATLSLGQIGTPWNGFEEGIWKHRFVSKVLPDLQGFLGSVDRGVGLKGKLLDGKIEYDAQIVNGEGAANETNKYKDFIGKVTFIPGSVAGLKLHLYGQKGDYTGGLVRNRTIVGISYESEKWNGMINYYGGNDKAKGVRGISVHGVFNIDPKKWVFARYDNWDPDKDTNDDKSTNFILGVGHKISDRVRGALNYQSLSREKETATKSNRNALYYSLEVKF